MNRGFSCVTTRTKSMSSSRLSGRIKTPSVKAKLNAIVEARKESKTKTSLRKPEERGTVQLSAEDPKAKKRRHEIEHSTDLGVKSKKQKECEVKEMIPAEPEFSGCGSIDPQKSKDVYPFIRGRSMQIHLLTSLLTGESLPPFLYVYGVNGSGKTYTLTSVLTKLKLKCAVVNCRECYCPELLFTEILTQLSAASSQGSVVERCHCIRRFLPLLKQVQAQDSTCLVLDNAECLREHPLLLSALTRLSELSGSCRLCVIFVTVVAANELFCKEEFLYDLPIHFPQYSKEETLEIMMLDCPLDKPLPFFQTFVHHIWNVFHTICCDLSELRHLSSTLFPKYIEPVNKGEMTYQNTRLLWRHIEPFFKTVMNRVYLREISFSKCEGEYVESSPLSLLELPLYSQYLLIASYLASYNPSRTDRRFFSKLKQPKIRKSHLTKTSEQSGHHLGPKEFSLDRMMAIFYSIVTETLPPLTSLYSQVSALVSLQLLARTSKNESLDLPKYKCLISLAIAQQLSKAVGFELLGHLHQM